MVDVALLTNNEGRGVGHSPGSRSAPLRRFAPAFGDVSPASVLGSFLLSFDGSDTSLASLRDKPTGPCSRVSQSQPGIRGDLPHVRDRWPDETVRSADLEAGSLASGPISTCSRLQPWRGNHPTSGAEEES